MFTQCKILKNIAYPEIFDLKILRSADYLTVEWYSILPPCPSWLLMLWVSFSRIDFNEHLYLLIEYARAVTIAVWKYCCMIMVETHSGTRLGAICLSLGFTNRSIALYVTVVWFFRTTYKTKMRLDIKGNEGHPSDCAHYTGEPLYTYAAEIALDGYLFELPVSSWNGKFSWHWLLRRYCKEEFHR